MMLRDVLDEIVRRRLWPIPVIAVVVALAVPLLFLKSAPPPAPAPAAAVASTQLDLPARAQRLLTSTDASATARGRLSRTARDPFRAPVSHAKRSGAAAAGKSASAKTTAQSSSSAGSTATRRVPVIVLTPKGATSKTATTKASTRAAAPSGGTSTARSSEPYTHPTVDMRFGAEKDSPIQRRVVRLKTFEVGGRIALVFVKYSHARHEAVFAIDPSTTVRGDVDCRRIDGLCRYVDIPVGRYARLTFTDDDGTRVSRRLDVVRVHGDA